MLITWSRVQPYAVVYDGFGNLYVSSQSTNNILKLTTAGGAGDLHDFYIAV